MYVFGEGTSGQRKGCPKGSFLGLCEDGLIKGVQTGRYTKSIKNKDYAIKAVELLRTTPSLSNTPEELWMLVIHGEPKSHNHQMDVVISLWNINMIE